VEWVKQLVIMGGALRVQPDMLYLPAVEHNIKCAPEAAKIVLESGIPLVLVPLDVTLKTALRRPDVERMLASDDAVLQGIGRMFERWLGILKSDWSAMHDPLALAWLIKPELLELVPLNMSVQLCGAERGRVSWYLAPESKAQAAIAVEAEAFHALLRKRLFG